MNEAAEHQADHGEGDHGLGDLEQFLIILGQPAPSTEPTERTHRRGTTTKPDVPAMRRTMISYVARRHGLSPSLVFRWRRLMSDGGREAVRADDEVVPATEVRRLEERVRELEQNNARQRYWYRRFQRRTIVVSKTRRMVDRTVALFARFDVNGTLEIAQLFGFPTIVAILAEVP